MTSGTHVLADTRRRVAGTQQRDHACQQDKIEEDSSDFPAHYNLSPPSATNGTLQRQNSIDLNQDHEKLPERWVVYPV
nr:hypothetical protein [uncultured Rhodopila sp.]